MCGIVGVVARSPVNQLLYDGMTVLQHRGQDAAGIVTAEGHSFHMHKGRGLVRDVFRTRNMRALPGNAGLGQVRYPTAGNADSEEEAQPFYVNAPFGITLAHNGNLTNAQKLKAELFSTDHRHINTESDTEVLVNVFAHELERTTRGLPLTPQDVFSAVGNVHRRIRGSYAVRRAVSGAGLGLSIVNGLAQLHGGELTIHSDLGKGTVISVGFPVSRSCYRREEPGTSESTWIAPSQRKLIAVTA